MHALGCFGSTLAFDRKAQACQSCDGMIACEARVVARHPAMQALLSRFSDVSGDPMSIHWMTPEEKRERKRQMEIAAFAEAATRTVGDAPRAVAVRDSLDEKATEFFDQMIFDGIDPFHAPIEKIAKSSKEAGAVVNALLATNRINIKDLAPAVAAARSVKPTSAQRYAYAIVSILVACDRAALSVGIVELK